VEEVGGKVMTFKKYKLTDETIAVAGRTLHRVKALREIHSIGVKVGDLGGFVECEHNLSHMGTSWIAGNALVFDDARVCGAAQVFDDARVYGNALVFDDARVYGNALVFDDARVCGAGEEKGKL
jgi:hypothetical protein